jgi:hypothetical protein
MHNGYSKGKLLLCLSELRRVNAFENSLSGDKLQRLSKEIFSKVRRMLQHELLEATAHAKGFVAAVNLSDESTESNRTFYLISLMLFISLVLLAPDKIPQTFATAQANSVVLDKIQEIVKKVMPFIG